MSNHYDNKVKIHKKSKISMSLCVMFLKPFNGFTIQCRVLKMVVSNPQKEDLW